MRETLPLLTVIEAVAEEVLAEEDLDPPPQPVGQEQRNQQDDRPENEYGRRRRAPVPAEFLDVITADRHQQQVDAGAQERHSEIGGLARQEHVDLPVRIATRRDGEERHHARVGESPRHPQAALDLSGQHGRRQQHEVVAEYADHRDAQVADRLSRDRIGRAVDALDERETDQGKHDTPGDVHRRRRPETANRHEAEHQHRDRHQVG